MLLIGVLLTSVIMVVGVEVVGYRRGGYDSEFWRLPLDDKLDHVVANLRDWWWISIWGLVGIALMTGGVSGLVFALHAAGAPVAGSVGLGVYMVAVIAWAFGLIIQTTAVATAAVDRLETGFTPGWIQPLWNAGYLAEGTWIIGANLAYVLIGVSVLQSGLIASWAGWASIVLGLAIPMAVVALRNGFPQLAGIVPFILGFAIIIDSI